MTVRITDIALLRYLDRARLDLAGWQARGVDVEAVRRSLAATAGTGVAARASAVVVDGVRLLIGYADDNPTVVTTLKRRTARKAPAHGRRGRPLSEGDEL